MGKLVKYCSTCEESFAEKFSFCPNCAAQLQKFEMNPVTEEPKEAIFGATETSKSLGFNETLAQVFATPSIETKPEIVSETPAFYDKDENAEVQEIEVEGNNGNGASVESSKTAEPAVLAQAAPSTKTYENRYQTFTASGTDDFQTADDDGGFHVTVIQEKNSKQRNMLLLGSMFLMLFLSLGGVVYSLFAKSLDLAAIDGDNLGVLVPQIEEEPMVTEEPEKPKKDDKAGGGGGGGGREELVETSKGRLANQMPDPPMITPTKTIPQKSNFELKQIATTQGNRQFKQTEENYGDPNSKNTAFLSDGMGKGGGQGSGLGTGQGSGRGTGQGSGIGSGSGSGVGDGDGPGTGSGNNVAAKNPPPPPAAPPKPVGVSQKVQIISKPRANYTDEARQNNVQGTVTVKVTFLANGQIGGVTPVTRLGYGLTEQAIAAAKAIKFEPAKRDGVPYTTAVSVQYNFTIY